LFNNLDISSNRTCDSISLKCWYCFKIWNSRWRLWHR